MSSEMTGQSFLVDPAAPLTGPEPKIIEGLPQGSPIEEKISAQLDETMTPVRAEWKLPAEYVAS